MNFIPKLKVIPLTAIIALGLALSPTLSMADNKNHGRQKDQYSHDGGKSHIKAQRNEQHIVHGYDKRGKGHVTNNYFGKPHVARSKHVYYANYPYRHEHHGHSDVEYIVVDHDHHDHYVDYDDVRFKIGVHTGNFDIVFRD